MIKKRTSYLLASALLPLLSLGLASNVHADVKPAEQVMQVVEKPQVPQSTNKQIEKVQTPKKIQSSEVETTKVQAQNATIQPAKPKVKEQFNTTVNKVNQPVVKAPVKKVVKPQGSKKSLKGYATVRSDNYTIWKDFNWTKQTAVSSKNYYHDTLKVNGKYNHQNGSTYYSMWGLKGWIGYLNSNALYSVTNSEQGSKINDNQFIGITKNNYDLWSDFKFNHSKGSTKNIYQKTLKSTGFYNSYNGRKYYSVYNNKSKWQGYLNSNAIKVTSSNGYWISGKQNIQIAKKDYDVYSGFFNKITNTTNLINQKYVVKGHYNNFNGYTYVSLYTNKGKWVGYVNSHAVGQPTVNNKVLLNVKPIGQNPEFPTGCEAVATTMMLHNAGVNVSASTVVDAMPRSTDGNYGFVGNPRSNTGLWIFPPAMVKVARKFVKTAVDMTGATFAQIKNKLNIGHAVVAWITGFGGSGTKYNHAITLIGYDLKKVFFNDPWSGKQLSMNISTLENYRKRDLYRTISY